MASCPGEGASVKESALTRYLVQECTYRGLLSIKLAPTGSNGWPDWLVVGEYGVHGFIELKRPGERPSKLQQRRLDELAERAHLAVWADSLGGVKNFLERLAGNVVGEAVLVPVSGPDDGWTARGRGGLMS